jgi:hypothetical protein
MKWRILISSLLTLDLVVLHPSSSITLHIIPSIYLSSIQSSSTYPQYSQVGFPPSILNPDTLNYIPSIWLTKVVSQGMEVVSPWGLCVTNWGLWDGGCATRDGGCCWWCYYWWLVMLLLLMIGDVTIDYWFDITIDDIAFNCLTQISGCAQTDHYFT